MRFTSIIVAAFAGVSILHAADSAPRAANLLPPDTIAVVSVPDWEQAAALFKASPQGQLWQDPAVKPLRERFLQQIRDEYAAPLQRGMGVDLAEFARLFSGQVTFALTANGGGNKLAARPGILLMADTKNQQDTIKTRLDELRKRWVDAGRKLKTETIRNLEFTTLIISSETAAEEGARPSGPHQSLESEIVIGHSGSLLLISNSAIEIEKVLSRSAGENVPALAGQNTFQASQSKLFGDALVFVWVSFAPIYGNLVEQASTAGRGLGAGLFAFRPERMLAATGLGSLKSVAAKLTTGAEGTFAEIFLNAPASSRQGLLKLLTAEEKEAAPPAFVGADAVKFSRYRIDGTQAWATLEKMLGRISPEASGLLQLVFQSAGKDLDPDFDLKKALIGNLGDDFISWRKKLPSSGTAAAKPPPALFLVRSPDPEQFVKGLHAATALAPLIADEPTMKEREFLGRTVYSVTLSFAPDAAEPGASTSSFHFAATGRYAALSSDISILEDYIRNSDASGKPLREAAGLVKAAQKVGGMSTGTFGYGNQAESLKVWLASARDPSGALDRLRSLSPLAGQGGLEGSGGASDWFDPALLPAFDQVSKYFHFVVYSLSSTEEGLSWKLFMPAPPVGQGN
jgi:hypothetical protein